MAKARLAATVTQEVTVNTEVKLSTRARQMLLDRIAEDRRLSADVKVKTDRRNAIKGEVEELFIKEGQGAALMEGCEIDGNPIKLVTGSSSKLDETKLMKKFGITKAQLDACRVTKSKKPYVRLGKAERKEEGE
jgi:hypothetical protein